MFVPNEASVHMKSKVFNICLWERLVVDINSGAGFLWTWYVWIYIHLLSVAIEKASDGLSGLSKNIKNSDRTIYSEHPKISELPGTSKLSKITVIRIIGVTEKYGILGSRDRFGAPWNIGIVGDTQIIKKYPDYRGYPDYRAITQHMKCSDPAIYSEHTKISGFSGTSWLSEIFVLPGYTDYLVFRIIGLSWKYAIFGSHDIFRAPECIRIFGDTRIIRNIQTTRGTRIIGVTGKYGIFGSRDRFGAT
jgi:hypothetical protein